VAYPERIRKYWLDVSNNECQYETYTEKRGFTKCGSSKKLHVHHIVPEGKTKYEGGNPDENVAMVVCERHHVKNSGDEPHSKEFCFHPDIAQAFDSYHSWKKHQQIMDNLKDKKIKKRKLPSPFQEVAKQHRWKIVRGERYVAGSEEIDQHYLDKMRNKATRHNVVFSAEKPIVKRKRKHKPKPTNWEWSKGLYERT